MENLFIFLSSENVNQINDASFCDLVFASLITSSWNLPYTLTYFVKRLSWTRLVGKVPP